MCAGRVLFKCSTLWGISTNSSPSHGPLRVHRSWRRCSLGLWRQAAAPWRCRLSTPPPACARASSWRRPAPPVAGPAAASGCTSRSSYVPHCARESAHGGQLHTHTMQQPSRPHCLRRAAMHENGTQHTASTHTACCPGCACCNRCLHGLASLEAASLAAIAPAASAAMHAWLQCAQQSREHHPPPGSPLDPLLLLLEAACSALVPAFARYGRVLPLTVRLLAIYCLSDSMHTHAAMLPSPTALLNLPCFFPLACTGPQAIQ